MPIGGRVNVEMKENSLFMKKGEIKDVKSILTLNGIFNLISDVAAPNVEFEYKSQNEAVATVGADGKVAAKATGITYVRLKITQAGGAPRYAYVKIEVVPNNANNSASNKYK